LLIHSFKRYQLLPGRYGIEIGDVISPARMHVELVGDRLVVKENAWARDFGRVPASTPI